MDFKEIQTIIKNFEKSNLTELEIEKGDFKLRLSKQLYKDKENQDVKDLETEELKDPNLVEVKAPLVGTFYIKDRNGEDFVKAGDHVQEGDTICIIEAMKILNEITAPKSGIIQEVKLKNGDPVGFDQVMITIL
ncbi:MAG TPA: acetyl-CoA carboxylase biotin carboxyl carrier protein [Acholeplasmataceae bacterium]|jgi:acetyl-CoA carboxylase biotin carboxyl carrier protein|nr:acetyl-CoA carboxylase biotin carboxyl carrier protein [Acholeplasmataceae bacterium]